MIKVFSTSVNADLAAQELNSMLEEWKKDFGNNGLEITDFKITSNNMGWMLVVYYRILRF
jgi:hypothetical protein